MRILFQGDSITDCGRFRDEDLLSGSGYPTMVAGELGLSEPGKHECLNRGVSGNRVVDLYARWKCDAIDVRPDLISILIGVNDVWHEYENPRNGVEADRFEKIYDLLLEYTREALPDCKIIILEPYVQLGRATERNWAGFQSETPLRARAAERIAKKYGARFVPLQKPFDDALALAPSSHWLHDGVHPTSAGHRLIAREWLNVFHTL